MGREGLTEVPLQTGHVLAQDRRRWKLQARKMELVLKGVLVYLSCYNKIPDGAACKQQKFIFLSRRLEVRDQGASTVGFWWGPLPDYRLPASHSVLLWWEESGSSAESLIRALIPFMRALSSWPIYLPKALPPKTITLEVRVSTYEFWGVHILTIAKRMPNIS